MARKLVIEGRLADVAGVCVVKPPFVRGWLASGDFEPLLYG